MFSSPPPPSFPSTIKDRLRPLLSHILTAIMDVVSKREKPKYSHNGHQYVFDKLTKDGSKKMWRCDRKDHGCKARLHTDAATDDVIGDV